MNLKKLLKFVILAVLSGAALFVAVVAVMFLTQELPPDEGLLKLTSAEINESSKSYYPIIHRAGSKLYVANNANRMRKEDVAVQEFWLYDKSPGAPVIVHTLAFNCKTRQYSSLDDNNDKGSVVSGSPLESVMWYACWQPPLTRLSSMFK